MLAIKLKKYKPNRIALYIVFFISLAFFLNNLQSLIKLSIDSSNKNTSRENVDFYYETNDFLKTFKEFNESVLDKIKWEDIFSQDEKYKRELKKIDEQYKEELGLFQATVEKEPKSWDKITIDKTEEDINSKYYNQKVELKENNEVYQSLKYNIEKLNEFGNINYLVKNKKSGDIVVTNLPKDTNVENLDKSINSNKNDFYMVIKGNETGVSDVKTNLNKSILEENFKFYFNYNKYNDYDTYYYIPREKTTDDYIYKLEQKFKTDLKTNIDPLGVATISTVISLILISLSLYFLYKNRRKDIEDLYWIERKYYEYPIEFKVLIILILDYRVNNYNYISEVSTNYEYVKDITSRYFISEIIVKALLLFSIFILIKYFMYIFKKYNDKSFKNILESSLVYKYWNKNGELYFQGEPILKKKIIPIIILIGIFTWMIFMGVYDYDLIMGSMIVISLALIFHILRIYRNLKGIAIATYKMAKGDLNVNLKEDGDILTRNLAKNINNINKGFKSAIEKEIKSERMKSELITNVSHDLKTPLTSIINYVDLLKNKDLDDERKMEYIHILDRKSKRLKILIEDLFEATKASSRSMELNLSEVDIVALLRQTIGEFRDKIDKSNLDFRIDIPKKKVCLMLDGKKTWRIFENLIINILKYSMNGSRVYIDFLENEEDILITMKNISAYEMNFKEEEIIERFSRGDESRNTEGSGLGLAITKSLVELQNGTFKLDIDGDLFKITLKFNKYNNLSY